MKKILLFIVLILMTSCSFNQTQQQEPEPSNSVSLFDELLSYKKPFHLPEKELDLNFTVPTLKDLEVYDTYSSPVFTSSLRYTHEALEDLETFKWLFRTFYGRYPLLQNEYEQAFIDMEEEINKFKSTITRDDLSNILHEGLQFDHNYHLSIDGRHQLYRDYNFFNTQQSYIKQDNKFINSETHQVLEDTKYLVPFLYPNLEVVYHQKNNPNSLTREFETTSSIQRLELDEEFEYAHQNIIEEINEEFDNFSRKVRTNKSIMILDLRDNLGGFEFYPGQWFKQATHHDALYSYQGYLRRNPQIDDDFSKSFIETTFNVNSDGTIYKFTPSDKILDFDGLIIVLQNQFSHSGAEKMIDLLHHLDNTLFIGTNSGGAYSSNFNGRPFFLSNSGIQIMLGDSLYDFNPLYYEENVGFEPDLYVLDKNMQEVISSILQIYKAK